MLISCTKCGFVKLTERIAFSLLLTQLISVKWHAIIKGDAHAPPCTPLAAYGPAHFDLHKSH